MKGQIIIIVIMMSAGFIFSQTPTYDFITEPIDLITNYYDYMPGSYNALPIQIEEDGGSYIVFHARETPASTRRVYYAYVNANGSVTNIATISDDDIHEGYPGIDLDPVTGDPFVAWHANVDETSANMEVVFNYDRFHLGSPGYWLLPFVVFDDETPSPNMPFDEFMWPEVHIGPSPIPDKRRVYIIGKNSDNMPAGNPSENVLIGYADFNEDDLNGTTNLNWTYRTIELLDQWHMGNPEWVRPFISCSVSEDGQLAFMGYIAFDSSITNMTDQIFVLYNDNFGEGDFEYYWEEAHYNVWFPGVEGVYFTPYLCHHQNSIFHAGNSQISFLGAMNMKIEPNSWYPDLMMLYTKIFNFDVITQEFSFYDLYIEGANPADNIPMIPWDLNEDGIVDSTNANGDPVWVDGWPIYHPDNGVAFHENNFKITKNEENGWLAAIWNDGLKARYAENGVAGYEDWLEVPEIAICISADNGENWSQPIMLNANDTPELEDMIPCYIYPGDKIEDLGNNHGKLHLFFLDDYSFGSSIQGHGENLGGMQKYCSLDIDFGDFTDSPEITVPTAQIKLTNYPNPFNPATTISFSIEQNEQFKLEIYNLKGQKVKNLSPSLCHPEPFDKLRTGSVEGRGEVKVTWNGTDQTGKLVSSGVYFAKLKAGNQVATRKMLLLK